MARNNLKLYFWSLSSVFFFNVIGDCYPPPPSPPPCFPILSIALPVPRDASKVACSENILRKTYWITNSGCTSLHPPTQVKKFWQGHLFSRACAWCLWEDRQLYHHGSRPQRVNIETCVCFCTCASGLSDGHISRI